MKPIIWTFSNYWYCRSDKRWYEMYTGFEPDYPTTCYKSVLLSEGAD